MIIKYSATDAMQAGLTKTFDCEHPCEHCKSIAKHTGAEKKHATQAEFGKLNTIAQPNATVLHPSVRFWYQHLGMWSTFLVDRPPLVPSPRDLIG